MKRRVGLILLLLVAGAIVNVAVAWGFVIFSEPPLKSSNGVKFIPDSWRLTVPSNWKLPTDGTKHTRVGTDVVFFAGEGGSERADIAELLICQSGWPCRSMFWHAWLDAMENARGFEFAETGNVWADGIDLQPPDADHHIENWRRLPVRPIWPGFAINTLFYAGILLGGLAALRRAVRAAKTQAHQARPVPGVCVSGWRQRIVYGMWKTGDSALGLIVGGCHPSPPRARRGAMGRLVACWLLGRMPVHLPPPPPAQPRARAIEFPVDWVAV